MSYAAEGALTFRTEPTGPECIHCGTIAEPVPAFEVYGGVRWARGKWLWVCGNCNARVGCHGKGLRPLGRPANAELRRARMLLHGRRLDPLWKSGKMTRNEVYGRLRKAMGLTTDECHVGEFDLDQTREAWVICTYMCREVGLKVEGWKKAVVPDG